MQTVTLWLQGGHSAVACVLKGGRRAVTGVHRVVMGWSQPGGNRMVGPCAICFLRAMKALV